jgi:hypothetical protein
MPELVEHLPPYQITLDPSLLQSPVHSQINILRGPGHIISVGPLHLPELPNSILDTEFSKIKKYPFVFHAFKSFLCI